MCGARLAWDRAVRATLVTAPHLPALSEACISMGRGQGQHDPPQKLYRSPRQARETPEQGRSSSAHPQSCPIILKGLQSGPRTNPYNTKLSEE